MILDALRQQTFASSLSPARESSAAALRFHARAKTMLAFARSFRCLIGAFHGMVERDGNSKSDILIVNIRYRKESRAPWSVLPACHVERSRDISEFLKRVIR